MGLMMLSAGVASMFLPETLGTPLPQTLNDAEMFGITFPFCYCPRRPHHTTDDDDEQVNHKLGDDDDVKNAEQTELLEHPSSQQTNHNKVDPIEV
jgi:hypothetical protein